MENENDYNKSSKEKRRSYKCLHIAGCIELVIITLTVLIIFILGMIIGVAIAEIVLVNIITFILTTVVLFVLLALSVVLRWCLEKRCC